MKTIHISIETWESVCELVESIIRNKQVAFKKRWFSLETFFRFSGPTLQDPIEDSLPPNFKLE